MIKTALNKREIDLKRELNETEILQSLRNGEAEEDSIESLPRADGRTWWHRKRPSSPSSSLHAQAAFREDLEAEIDKAVGCGGASSVKDRARS
jgi:hypothetical protein